MTFDAGGSQRQACVVEDHSARSAMKWHGQVNMWVEDLTEQEAQQLLELKGHAEDWKQFTAACSPAAIPACLEGFLCPLS